MAKRRGLKTLLQQIGKITVPKPKQRKMWLINPTTKIVPSKKIYNRKKLKQELKNLLKTLDN